LHKCLKALKQICWTRELYLEAQKLSDVFGVLIYDGQYFGDLKEAIDSFFSTASEVLSGELILKISNRNVEILTRSSPYSLYSDKVVSFENDEIGINKAALGYMTIKGISDLQLGLRKERI